MLPSGESVSVAAAVAAVVAHGESKKQDTKLLAITSLLSDFQNFFTSRLGSKFVTNSCSNIPPRFKHVATLPSEK